MSIPWTTVEAAIWAWAVEATGLPSASVLWARQGKGRPSAADPYAELSFLAVQSLCDDWTDQEVNYVEIDDDIVEDVDPDEDTLTLTGHGYQDGDGPLEMDTTGVLPGGVPAQFFAIVVDPDTIQLAATAQLAIAGTALDITSAGSGVHTIVDTDETLRVGTELALKTRGPRQATLAVQCFAGAPPAADLAVGNDSPHARLERMVSYANRHATIAALNAAGVGVGAFDPVVPMGGFLGPATVEPRAVTQARLFLAAEVEDFVPFVERAEVTNSLTGGVTEIDL